MTVINPKSISGITSITLPSGGDNVLTIHTNDGVERFRVDSSGNVKVGSAATISPDGDVFFTGVCTATTLAGAASGLTGALPALDGSALTGVASTENIRTNTNATFLQNINVSGITTVGSAVTISESGIEASGIGITVANINGGHIGGRRNKIINGAMQVNQRGGTTSSPAYGIDRWWQVHGGSATMAQDATVPSGEGFSYSMKLSNVSGDVSIGQPIELDSAGKQSGFPAGKKMTFSFYAKCDSGTDGISVYAMFRQGKYDATNQVNFTGSAAGVTLTTTWTRHVVTMTIPTCHSGSTMVAFEMGGITGTSYFTGFQAEIGDQATPFEHLSFAEEERLCMRYFENVRVDSFPMQPAGNNGVNSETRIPYQVKKRAAPTVTKDGNLSLTLNGTNSNNTDHSLGGGNTTAATYGIHVFAVISGSSYSHSTMVNSATFLCDCEL